VALLSWEAAVVFRKALLALGSSGAIPNPILAGFPRRYLRLFGSLVEFHSIFLNRFTVPAFATPFFFDNF
jgi:hypothetical protein